MKRIAFYVEGQTEQFFVKELLIEIAGRKNIQVELEKFAGKASPRIQLVDLSLSPASPKYSALIYDCCGDGSVKTRMLEDYSRLFSTGYSKIIGVRDLFPLTDLARLERTLGTVQPLPANADIIIAVNEVEAWFLAETNHFSCINPRITIASVISALGVDPTVDDMSLLSNPAVDLDNVYKIAGERYTKRKSNVERTVNCLDYSNLYLNVRHKMNKLDDLITAIDHFLT